MVLGTTLATSAFIGGYVSYVRRAEAACTLSGGGTYTCSGVTNETQTIGGSTITTLDDFSLDTTVSGGNAFTINTGYGLSFTDVFASTIDGAVDGIDAANYYGGGLSITVTGPVSGASGNGIVADNNGDDGDLTIVADDVSGGLGGIIAEHYTAGALSITSTGTVTGFGVERHHCHHILRCCLRQQSHDHGCGCDRRGRGHRRQSQRHWCTDHHYHGQCQRFGSERHLCQQPRHQPDGHRRQCERPNATASMPATMEAACSLLPQVV